MIDPRLWSSKWFVSSVEILGFSNLDGEPFAKSFACGGFTLIGVEVWLGLILWEFLLGNKYGSDFIFNRHEGTHWYS